MCSRGILGDVRVFCAPSVFIRLAEQLGHLSHCVFLGDRGYGGDRPRFIPSWPLHLFVPWLVPGLASLSLTYKTVVTRTRLTGRCAWVTCCRPLSAHTHYSHPSRRHSDCTRALRCLSWQFLCGPPIRLFTLGAADVEDGPWRRDWAQGKSLVADSIADPTVAQQWAWGTGKKPTARSSLHCLGFSVSNLTGMLLLLLLLSCFSRVRLCATP